MSAEAGAPRDMGEPGPIDVDALLAQGEWVRRLARGLVRGADAGDVEQETWLAAVERPPAGVASERGWLARVAANAARRLARGERRRAGREALLEPRADVPSAEEVARQCELARELAGLVLELDEPYRSTLLLRFWRGLAPAEIARAQGVPSATVRSRLKRGLEGLRERLDATRGGRSAWSAALVALVGRGDAEGEGAALAGGLAVGVLLKVGLGAVALAAAVAVAVVAGSRGEPERVEPARSGGEVALARPVGAPESPAPPSSARARAVGAEVAAGASSRPEPAPETLTGRVLAPDGTPLAGARVEVFEGLRTSPVKVTRGEGACGPDGDFALPARWIGEEGLCLEISAEGYRTLVIQLIAAEDGRTYTLPWVTSVTGTVRDAETGEGLEGVQVVDGPTTVVSGIAGDYRFDGVLVGHPYTLFFYKEGHVPHTEVLVLREPAAARLDVALQRGVPVVVALVDRATGEPVPGAEVRELAQQERPALADTSGRVTVRAAEGEPLTVTCTAEGYAATTWRWPEARLPFEGEARIPLAPVVNVRGELLDAAGARIAGVWAFAEHTLSGDLAPEVGAEELRALGLPGSVSFGRIQPSAPSDERGSFEIPVLVDEAPYRVFAGGKGWLEGARDVLVASAEDRPWVELRLQRGGQVRGRVMLAGEPLRGARVTWESTTGSGTTWTGGRGDAGYSLDAVPPGPLLLSVEWGGAKRLAEALVDVLPGQVLEHDFFVVQERGPIRGRVTDLGGAPLAGLRVSAIETGVSLRRTFDADTDAEGRYELRAASGATYSVSVGEPPIRRERGGVRVGDENVDFALEELGVARLRLRDAATGAPVRAWSTASRPLVWRLGPDGAHRAASFQPDLEGVVTFPAPVGAIEVRVMLSDAGYIPSGWLPATAGPAGRADETVVDLVRGVDATLVFDREVGASLAGTHELFLLEEERVSEVAGPFLGNTRRGQLGFTVKSDVGDLVLADSALEQRMLRGLAAGSARVRGLAPGTYVLRAFPDDLAIEPARFEIGDAPEQRFDVRVRPR